MVDVVFKRDGARDGVKVMFHDEDGKPYDEILTKQEFLQECDINNILRRHIQYGVVPNFAGEGVYADFSDVTNFQDAMIRIEECNSYFDSLPATLRARFENDTAKFLDYLDNPANFDEMVELGLVEKPTNYDVSKSVAVAEKPKVESEQ